MPPAGSIISDMLAYSFPTVVVYVVDTPRAAAPVTFMSNMLYACSIMYKLKLPFVLVFNKTDITPCGFAQEWMTDSEKFAEAVQDEKVRTAPLLLVFLISHFSFLISHFSILISHFSFLISHFSFLIPNPLPLAPPHLARDPSRGSG